MKKKKIVLIVILAVCLLLSSMSLIACDVKDDVAINFYLDDQLYCSVKILNGEFEMPTPPSKEGYTFAGWYLDKNFNQALDLTFAADEKISAGANLYAKFMLGEVVSCHIILEPNNGSNAIVFNLTETNFLFPSVEKQGYSFDGWFNDKALSMPWNTFDTLKEGDTLYAKWKYNLPTVLVNYQTNGGSDVAASYFDAGSKIVEPKCERESYNLVGWFIDKACTVQWNFDADTVKAGMTLYAKWVQKNHTVTVYGRGNVVLDNYTVEHGAKIKTLPVIENEGNFSFVGWFADATGQVIIDENFVVTNDLNIWSKWRENKEQVQVNYFVDGELLRTVSNNKNEIISQPLTPTSNDEKSFVGWFNSKEMTELWDFKTQTASSDIALYGAYKLPTQGLAMSLLADDTYAVAGVRFSECEQIVVPEVYNGKRVTAILANAFANVKADQIFIARSVLNIGDNAFNNMTISKIYLPYSILNMSSNAFNGVNSLENINLDTRNSAFTIYEDALYTSDYKQLLVYKSACARQVVNIHNETLYIADFAFANCLNLKRVYFGKKVHTIGKGAFINCAKLETVVFPEKINVVGNMAFKNCRSLEELKLPSTVFQIGQEAFCDNENLKKLTLPLSCNRIGERAFKNLKSLTNVEISSSIAVVERNAFDDCKGVIYLNYPSLPKNWANDWTNSKDVRYSEGIISENGKWQYTLNNGYLTISAYLGTETNVVVPSVIDGYEVAALGAIFCGNTSVSRVVIEAEIKEIIANTFNGATKLGSVVLPNTLAYVGEKAFYKCSSLASIALRAGVQEIGDGAFMYCSSLQRVELSASMIRIADNAFANCTMLSNIKFNDSLKYIGDSAFYNCTSLQSVTWNKQLTNIGKLAFYNCVKLKNLTLPENLSFVDDYAFNNCSALTNVYISSNVQIIGAAAFKDCFALNKLTFANNSLLSTIKESAFSGCLDLEILELPASLKNLDDNAFMGNISLKTLRFGKSLIKIGAYAFKDCDLKDIDLPSSVKYVGDGAFSNNKNMDYVVVSANIIKMSYTAFLGIVNVDMYIKDGVLINYWGSWNNGNNIVLDGMWDYVDGVPTKKNV